MNPVDIVRAIVKNNDGVQQVSKGAFEQAVTSFAESLEILKPLVRDDASMRHLDAAESISIDCQSRATDMDCSSMAEDTILSTTSQSSKIRVEPFEFQYPKGDETIEHGYIFRDAIEIPIDAVARSSLSQKLFLKLSIVVLYNLALAFHLTAVVEGGKVNRLDGARKLYEYAFQLHLQENCDVTLLFSIAIMNNLGLIYRTIGEREQSEQCWENVLATMMFLLEAGEANNIKQWDGLISNVMRIIATNSVAPAA